MRSSLFSPKRRNRSFQPHFETLEDRWCPSCTVRVIDGHILEIVGDRSDNQIAIVHNSDGLRVSCDDESPRSFQGIDQIMVQTGDGNDLVRMLEEGPEESLGFFADLGNGDDRFVAALDIPPGPCLPQERPPMISMVVMGGNGNDALDLLVSGPAAESSTEPACLPAALDVQFDLGDGNDTSHTAWSNVAVNEPVMMNTYGGAGVDMIRVDVGTMPDGDRAAAPDVIIANTWTGKFSGGGGNDFIIAILLPAVQRGGIFSATMEGENGQDTLIGRQLPAVQRGGTFRSFMGGGRGNDLISQLARPTVASDALCLMRVTGDLGADQLMGSADPSLAPRANCELDFLGGAGDDTINELLDLPSLTAGSNLTVFMNGEGGDDHLALLVSGQADPLAVVDLEVDGGPGFDIATVASIVHVFNCEQVIIL